MRLLGAKEFLRTVKPGTLFVEFWRQSQQECLDLIKDYKSGMPVYKLIAKYYGSYYIFGDNGGSLTFLVSYDEEQIEIDGIVYNCFFYYDKNIFGDASPTETLNLVFDNEDEWPKQILPENCNEDIKSVPKILNKEDVKKIRKYFLKECGPFRDETSKDAWALQKLETDEYYKDDFIVNYKEGEETK